MNSWSDVLNAKKWPTLFKEAGSEQLWSLYFVNAGQKISTVLHVCTRVGLLFHELTTLPRASTKVSECKGPEMSPSSMMHASCMLHACFMHVCMYVLYVPLLCNIFFKKPSCLLSPFLKGSSSRPALTWDLYLNYPKILPRRIKRVNINGIKLTSLTW